MPEYFPEGCQGRMLDEIYGLILELTTEAENTPESWIAMDE